MSIYSFLCNFSKRKRRTLLSCYVGRLVVLEGHCRWDNCVSVLPRSRLPTHKEVLLWKWVQHPQLLHYHQTGGYITSFHVGERKVKKEENTFDPLFLHTMRTLWECICSCLFSKRNFVVVEPRQTFLFSSLKDSWCSLLHNGSVSCCNNFAHLRLHVGDVW